MVRWIVVLHANLKTFKNVDLILLQQVDINVINVEHVVIGSETVQISNQEDHRNWLTYDYINNYILINGLLHR